VRLLESRVFHDPTGRSKVGHWRTSICRDGSVSGYGCAGKRDLEREIGNQLALEAEEPDWKESQQLA
jgi:hypothetical protein